MGTRPARQQYLCAPTAPANLVLRPREYARNCDAIPFHQQNRRHQRQLIHPEHTPRTKWSYERGCDRYDACCPLFRYFPAPGPFLLAA